MKLILAFDRDPLQREHLLNQEWTPSPDRQGAMACARCGAIITDVSARITMHGAHYHRVANPAGITFEIGCYRDAVGVRLIGEPSHEFTWFDGYAWQVINCAQCQSHLGWRYVGGHAFFAFILRQLHEVS